ncbi:MAG: hypothetical protein R3F48_01800 [Candidatus Zixiibacteriota bacterium]
MKRHTSILFVLLALLTASSAFGQGNGGGGGNDFARLWAAIEKTDEVIERAKIAVQESGSERAFQELKAAITLQEVARRMADEAVTVDMGIHAGSRTLQARTKAERAIAITRQAGENEDFVRKRLEQTQEMIQRMEGRVDSDTPANILQLLDSAKDRYQRAQEFFRNGRLKAALQITLQIQKSLENALQKLGNIDDVDKQYQYALERFYALEERIQESEIAQDEAVQQQLQAAREMKEEAQQAYAAQHVVQAEMKIRNAVERLYRLAERLKAPARIENELTSLQRRLAAIKDEIPRENNQLVEMYQNAEKHLEKAQQEYRRQQYDGAAAQLQATRQILRRIRDILGE